MSGKPKPAESSQIKANPAFGDGCLSALIEAAEDGIIGFDDHGIIRSLNPAAERLFGFEASELIGRNVNCIVATGGGEQDNDPLRLLTAGERHFTGRGTALVGRKKNGAEFPLEASVAQAIVHGERVFMGILRTQKEQVRALESFRAVVESAPTAIVMVNAEGNITLVNSQAEKYFGYNRSELMGQSMEILVPERFRGAHPGYRHAYYSSPAARPMGAGRDLFGRRKDGSEFAIEIGLNPIQTSEGVQVLSAIVDITQRKRAEEALRASKQDLEKAVAELEAKNEEIRTMTQQLWQAAKLASVGELAASIAHELNNPLATVCLRIESILQRTTAEDPRRRSLGIVEQETKRMADLVANLLQFSRRGEGTISTVDIREELTKAVELIDHHLRKRQIKVVPELALDTPNIFADRQKLRQVFLNLLTNAADAMPQGGTLTMRCRLGALPSGIPAVTIEFVDTGVGIAAQHLDKIMEPFFTTKAEGKGTGLGLAICRRVIQDHQGLIKITSEPGKGATVHLHLPVRSQGNVLPLLNYDGAEGLS